MSANWHNIFSVYNIEEEKKLSKELIEFINNNSNELAKTKIDKDYPDTKSAQDFIRTILLENNFNNDSYKDLLKAVPYIYPSLDFGQLSLEKAKSLVQNKTLIVNSDNYRLLKDNFGDYYISLIENDIEKFIEKIDTFQLDNSDRLLILESEKISINQKVEFINYHTQTVFTTEIELLNQLGNLLSSNLELKIDKEIINSVLLKSNLKALSKIKIFNKYNSLFNNSEIELFLTSLGEPYSTITENGKRPLIEYNDSNECFIKTLVQKKSISKYEVEKRGIRISTFRNK